MARPDESQPPDSTELKPPRNLHNDAATLNNYQLLECIGEGSFGQVWRAKKGDTEVALKILKTSMSSEETQRELKSLEVLQELKHKNLVQTHDFWSNGDQLFIEMELANGGSLKDRLKSWQSVGRKGIPEGELLKYFSEIAEALDYLHGQRPRRFLHRDVKPANILIVGGIAKLADFGLLRKVAGDNTGTKTQGGTPVFMAPESIKSDIFSPRTDLYSLAVTYAELRQGKLPFSGTTEYQVCNNILSSLPELSDDLYPGEREVLRKALDKDPNNRYGSCGEFVAALKESIPVQEPSDAPGEATVIPLSTTIVDSGTAPRNVFRRSATTVPRPAAETQAAPDAPVTTQAQIPPAPIKPAQSNAKTPLLIALALLILGVMGTGIWWFLNRPPIEPPPVARKMTIKSTPSNATVFIEDKPQAQKTDGTFEVPIAAFQLRLSLADYEDFVQQIRPNQDTLEVVLKKVQPKPSITRKMEIKTDPEGAIVTIDNSRPQQLTNGFFDVPMKSFQLRLRKPGYKDFDQTIPPGKDKLDIKLEPLKVAPLVRKIEIKTKPAGADVFVDGKKQTNKTNGTFEVPIGSKVRLELSGYKSVEQTILEDKKNDVIVVAMSPLIPPRSYALLIGVNQPTKNLPDFLHAEADVVELGRTLVAGGYKASDVEVLTRGQDAMVPNATRIRQRLTELTKKLTAADTLVVGIVGHIVAFSGERTSYFCPAESNLNDKKTLIALDEIADQLRLCPAQNKLLLLDGWRADLFTPPAVADDVKLQRDRAKELTPLTAATIYASCAAGERGQPHALLPHGLFVHNLIRALQGAASVEPNRQMSLDMLATYATMRVREDAEREYKLRQNPELLGGEDLKDRMKFTITDVLWKVHEGTLALEEKNYDKALAAFNDAEVKNRDYLEIYTGRALAHYHKGKEDAAHYQQAIEDCQRVIRADPRNAHAHGFLAQIAVAKAKLPGTPQEQAKEFEQALRHHEIDIKLDPQWAMAYNARGVTHAARRDYTEAIKDYTEAIRLNPNLKFPYENRGFAYTTKKEYESALKDLQKAIELNPAGALNYYRRGGVFRSLGQIEHALNDLNEAIKLDASNANFFYSRAVIQVGRKDFDKAIEDFTKTLKVAKAPDRETLYGRGYAYNEKGVREKSRESYDKAIEDLTAALKLSENYVLALYVRGVAYRNKARLDMNDKKLLDLAIEDFNQAIAQNPNHANAYYARGLAYRAKGEKVLGDADIQKAKKIDPKVGQSQDSP